MINLELGWLKARWLPPALVVLLTVAAFLPTLQNGFVNWDDERNFLTNPHYRGLGWTQLRWMFTTFLMGHYVPLTWLTLGLDYLLWGMRPGGYHLTSLLLHAATALVFYFVTLRLLHLARPGGSETAMRYAAGFAALLFALHPLRVESVTWVTERRDVLSGLFFLLAILAYLRACEGADRVRRCWLAASITAFALALLSKAVVMMLPLVLLALDAYPLRRLTPPARGVWREKLPFCLLALAGAIIALVALGREAPLRPLAEHGVAARLAQAGFGLAFYLWKTLVPLGLSPLYPLTLPLNPLAPPFVLSGMAVLLITSGALVARRRFPALTVAWVCYGGLLAPVLGITQQGAQITADRYSYLACLSWAVLAGAGLLAGWRAWEEGRIGRPLATLTLALALLTVGTLGVLTWRQVGVWHDSIRLWTHVLQVAPDSHFAHYNLGNALVRQGEYAEAIHHFRQALRSRLTHTEMADVYNNLGGALVRQGKLAEAIAAYKQALRLKPDDASARFNLARAYLQLNQREAALTEYRILERLDREMADRLLSQINR